MIRTFIALPLPDTIKQALQEAALTLKRSIDARWVRPEAMHFTLKFLGNIEEGLIEPISQGLDALCADYPVLDFCLDALGAFPNHKKARVIWVSLAGAAREVVSLAEQVDRLCARFGIAPESRSFRPHITLGRLKTPTMVELESKIPGLAFRVEEAVFFRSELMREGPRYTALHRSRLGGPQGGR
jgi:RNA 2',3'-cyclic 3'-phosphodiesterase